MLFCRVNEEGFGVCKRSVAVMLAIRRRLFSYFSVSPSLLVRFGESDFCMWQMRREEGACGWSHAGSPLKKQRLCLLFDTRNE